MSLSDYIQDGDTVQIGDKLYRAANSGKQGEIAYCQLIDIPDEQELDPA